MYDLRRHRKTAKELFRVTKPGGVVVWVVNDSCINGSETGTSFRQALIFKKAGWNLFDTMIYKKSNMSFPDNVRYYQNYEYMFVFSKGMPKTFNPIKDSVNMAMVRQGCAWHYKAFSKDSTYSEAERIARESKAGLWKDENPTAPWNWRKK